MESLTETPLLEFPPDLLVNVRKMYNLDQPGRMAEAVDILQEWVKKQEHFTKKDFARSYLETTIIGSKGSLERAKTRLDKLCTFRTLWPNLFEITDLKKDLAPVLHVLWFNILPKLTKDNYRVVLLQLRATDFQASDFVKLVKSLFNTLEYLKQHDYAVGYIVISDYMDINVSELLPKISLSELQQLITVVSDGYGARIKALAFMTPSKLIDGFIKLVKQFVPAKISNRLQVYRNVDELCEFVPREILPLEYGGTARSCQEIHDDWLDALSSEEHGNFLKDMNEARIDESLRKIDKFDEQYMGMPGTFRTLSVD